MAETGKIKNIGLRGVTVADSRICFIDGENGILVYRGYRIEDLARNSTFEETAYLLLHDELPAGDRLKEFRTRLEDAREVPAFVFDMLKRMPSKAHPMDVLQAAIPLLAMSDPDLESETREANIEKAIRLIARIASVVAGWDRIRKGLEPLPPDPSLSHAGNFLWQLNGTKPDKETERELDVILVLHADHGFNPSTFACREVVSTRAHMYAGVAAGVGALSGSLHGGANAEVMSMLKNLRNGRDIAAWIRNELDSGRKIMGMGHAVYKTTDPRALFLREACFRIGNKLGHNQLCEILTRIEENAIEELGKRGKTTVKPNVDFYSAPVYHMLGIAQDMMTPAFAVARIAGWSAHIIEEKFGEAQGKPMLYRPSSEYVGHYCGKTGCAYTPIGQRKK